VSIKSDAEWDAIWWQSDTTKQGRLQFIRRIQADAKRAVASSIRFESDLCSDRDKQLLYDELATKIEADANTLDPKGANERP